jgi:hypothetical protein
VSTSPAHPALSLVGPYFLAFYERDTWKNFAFALGWPGLRGLSWTYERTGRGELVSYAELVIFRLPDTPDIRYRVYHGADAQSIVQQAQEALRAMDSEEVENLLLVRVESVMVLGDTSFQPGSPGESAFKHWRSTLLEIGRIRAAHDSEAGFVEDSVTNVVLPIDIPFRIPVQPDDVPTVTLTFTPTFPAPDPEQPLRAATIAEIPDPQLIGVLRHYSLQRVEGVDWYRRLQ